MSTQYRLVQSGRLPAAAAQPAKVRQSCSATDFFILFYSLLCLKSVIK
jgi:hypothetical protein